jgi:hypothetical protein
MAEAVYGYAENKKSLLTRLAELRAKFEGCRGWSTTTRTASTSSPRSAQPSSARPGGTRTGALAHQALLDHDALEHGSTDDKANELVGAIGRLIRR